MGKSAPKAPNYQPVADASEKTATYAKEQADQQLAFAKQQYYDLKPIFEQITNAQLSQMGQTQQQGADYYNYLTQTYRPVESSLVRDAMNFDDANYREHLARQAAADSGLAMQQVRGAGERQMASMGVNPNSARFAGANRAADLGLAAERAGVMNSTRMQAEQMGVARRMDAAGLGRGLSGASVASYGAALNAGNSAGQNAMTPGQNFMQQYGQGIGTMQQGQQLQMQGLGGILNGQTGVYGAQAEMAAAQSQAIGLGVGGLAGMFNFGVGK